MLNTDVKSVEDNQWGEAYSYIPLNQKARVKKQAHKSFYNSRCPSPHHLNNYGMIFNIRMGDAGYKKRRYPSIQG